jgi:hypothetical protein
MARRSNFCGPQVMTSALSDAARPAAPAIASYSCSSALDAGRRWASVLSRNCGLQEDVVIDVEDLCKLLGVLLADRPLAVFHFGDVALWDTCQPG